MLFRKDTFIGNNVKPVFVEPVSDPTPLFIKPVPVEVPTPIVTPVIKPLIETIIKPLFVKPLPIVEQIEVPTPQPVIKPLFVKPLPIVEQIEVPTPQPVIKPLFVKPLPIVEQSQPFISQTPQEKPIFQNPQDVIDQTIVQEILPVKPKPIHIPNIFEIQQTTEQISEQATLFIEPVKTKIIENNTENEDINMVNDCTKHYTGGNSYFDPTLEPMTEKPVLPKEPILPFEHKPFGLMRIIVSILIVYIIFLKK